MVKQQFITDLLGTLSALNIDVKVLSEKYGDEKIYTEGHIISNTGNRYTIDLEFLMTSNYDMAVLSTIVGAVMSAAEMQTEIRNDEE